MSFIHNLDHGHLSRSGSVHRDPSKTNVYLIGGGIASLAAAVFLIRDAHVHPNNIRILEETKVIGGALDGAGEAANGYVMRGGRMLNFTYLCLYDLLRSIPTLEDKEKSVYQEILDFNKDHRSHAKARLVDKDCNKVDVTHMGLNTKDRIELLQLWMASEEGLGTKKISDVFSEHIFTTNFWFMWATTFAFQQWHSAVEFKRYLHRFIHEFPRINTLEGVDRTVYNQFDSIVLPIATWLQSKGVDFMTDTKVVDIDFDVDANKQATARRIHTTQMGTFQLVEVNPNDLVFVTNGSMTAASSFGSMTSAPTTITDIKSDGAWSLWSSIALKLGEEFAGNPSNFLNRIDESKWESFTVTIKEPTLINLIVEWSGNVPGTGGLVTFKDSSWLLSVVIPHQPHFRNQPNDVSVFWGYALFIDCPGNYVKKPMSECSGAEILQELLHHLGMSSQYEAILPNINVIPAILPYITSQFLTREVSDRPKVVPKGSVNFAWLGQWTEIPDDTVFTIEYSVRAAMMAVYKLMTLPYNAHPPAVYKGAHHLDVIYRALKMSFS